MSEVFTDFDKRINALDRRIKCLEGSHTWKFIPKHWDLQGGQGSLPDQVRCEGCYRLHPDYEKMEKHGI